jgi:hypothetical protein
METISALCFVVMLVWLDKKYCSAKQMIINN